MGKGSDSGGQTVQTQQESAPWSKVQPYLEKLFGSAQGLYDKGPMSYYPGQTVAGQSGNTLDAIRRRAMEGTSPNSLTNQGATQFSRTVAGDYLTPDSNPYLKASVDDALGQVRGQVNSVYGRGGGNNFGSSAHEENLTRTLAATALPIYAQNYQTERGRQLNAAQLAPGMADAGLGQLQQAGGMQDAYSQANINADKARYDFGQQSPWDALMKYQQAISGQGGGSSTGTQPYYPPNQLAQMLGLGIGATGMYGMGKNAGLWGGSQLGLAGGGAGGLGGLGGAAAMDYGAGAGLEEILAAAMLA